MATINGYTAERMKQIEDQAIVSGAVVQDKLILKRFNGLTFDAGNVRGPAGTPGAQDVDSKIAAALDLADPPGTPKPFTGAAAPQGHGICNAATEYSSSTYPKLAALYGTGAACINGASTAGTFRLPNLKGRVLVGLDAAVEPVNALHKTGGNKDSVVVAHTHTVTSDQAPHAHVATQNGHGHGINNSGAHIHTVDNDTGFRVVVTVPTSVHYLVNESSPNKGQAVTFTSIESNGNHGHSSAVEAPGIGVSVEDPEVWAAIGADGVSGVSANLMPYRVVNWVMRLV